MSEDWSPALTELEVEGGMKGLKLEDVNPDTAVVMGKLNFNPANVKPLVQPIYHTSTYRIDSVQEYTNVLKEGGYIYSRLGNPSIEQVECVVHVLEGGAGTMSFSSGMGAVTTAINLMLKSGDHVVCQNPIYSGTHKYITKYAIENKIEYTLVEADMGVEAFRNAIKDNTKLFIGETPCNPKMTILDLEEFGKLGREMGITTMIDSTFASPYLQQPIKYGIDLVVHSATKYLGGHSDIVAGIMTARTTELWKELNVYRTTIGNCLSPFDAYLLSRGLKTLHIRMERHSENAQKIAEYLYKHPLIDKVYYPGLKDHPNHDIAKKQMAKGFGGMIAFEVKGGFKSASSLIEKFRVVQLAVSLGGVESLIEHPASMTHGSMVMTDEERSQAHITDALVRLSVGIENFEDLLKDFQQALEQIKPLVV